MNPLFLIVFGLSALLPSALSESCSCGLEQLNTRIIHGKEAQRGRYPWLVSLLTKVSANSYSSCGASLINDRFVLTAAHCLANKPSPSDVIAMVGAHTDGERQQAGRDQLKLKVKSIKLHEDYDHEGDKMDDDIALIELAEPVVFDSKFTPVCLPSFSEHNNLFVYGWGRQNEGRSRLTNSKILHEVEIDEVENSTCTREYWGRRFLPHKEMCAGTKAGSCQGDSGGPLSTRVGGHVYQVGVVSFGTPGCGIEGKMKPDIYERVTAHMDWIQRNTRGAKWCPGPKSPAFMRQSVGQVGKSYKSGGRPSTQEVPTFVGLPSSTHPGGSGLPPGTRFIRLPDGRIAVVRPNPSNRGRL